MQPRHNLARHRFAVVAAFFTQGFTFVALTAKLPQVQDTFSLSPSAFSVLMLALVLCAGGGSVVGEKMALRRGSATVVRAGFLASALTLPLLAWAPGTPALAGAMAGYGVALGLVDAGSNMQAVSLEHRYGRPILPTFHGAWTCGGIVGTLGALATSSLSFHTSGSFLVLLPLLMLVAPLLPHDTGVEHAEAGEGVVATIPWRRIMLLGLALVLFYMVDTAVTTWAPTYVHRTFTTSGALVSIATLPYLVGSLVARVAGDEMTKRHGAAALVRLAALAGCLGLAVTVFAPNAYLALAGLGLVGLSLAVVAPLAYSAAAHLARAQQGERGVAAQAATDAVIARFNQFNYAGGLLGAVLTGALGDASLRYGFAVPMVLVLALLPLAGFFRVRS